MTTLHRSPRGNVFIDPRGLIEVIVNNDANLEMTDLRDISRLLVGRGIAAIPVLVTRINSYPAPTDFNILDLHEIGDLRVTRIAYYALSPSDQIVSNLMRLTAFRNVESRVVADRYLAVDWLLSKDAAPSFSSS